jgi:CHRD domain
MSRFSILAIAVTLFAAGCSDDTPTTPTTTPQNKFVFAATLAASNEVPAITNAESGANGTATVTMNTVRDSAGAITSATVDVTATFAGFPAGTVATLAHIHTGAAGVAGGVVVPMVPAAGEVTFPNGTGSFVKGGFPVTPVDVANQIINNPAGFYFNVHTALNPGGAVRGQLRLQ